MAFAKEDLQVNGALIEVSPFSTIWSNQSEEGGLDLDTNWPIQLPTAGVMDDIESRMDNNEYSSRSTIPSETNLEALQLRNKYLEEENRLLRKMIELQMNCGLQKADIPTDEGSIPASSTKKNIPAQCSSRAGPYGVPSTSYGQENPVAEVAVFQGSPVLMAHASQQSNSRQGNLRNQRQIRRQPDFSTAIEGLEEVNGNRDGTRILTDDVYYPETHQLFVGNLPHSVTVQGIKEVFEVYGQVAQVKILKPNQKAVKLNIPYFCFVVFKEAASALAAVAQKIRKPILRGTG